MSPLDTFGLLAALAFVTWHLRADIREAAEEPLWVEHICQDGEPIVYELGGGWSFDEVQSFLSEVERLPVCPEVVA